MQLLTCETGFMYAVPGTDWSSLRVTSTEAKPTAAESERGVGIQIREDYRRRCRIAIAAAVAAAAAAAWCYCSYRFHLGEKPSQPRRRPYVQLDVSVG